MREIGNTVCDKMAHLEHVTHDGIPDRADDRMFDRYRHHHTVTTMTMIGSRSESGDTSRSRGRYKRVHRTP